MPIQVAIPNWASGKQRGFIIRAEVEESPVTRVRRAQWKVSVKCHCRETQFAEEFWFHELDIHLYMILHGKKEENNNNTHEQPSFMCVFMSPISPGGSMVQGGELTAGARSQVGSLCFNRSDTTYIFQNLDKEFWVVLLLWFDCYTGSNRWCWCKQCWWCDQASTKSQ